MALSSFFFDPATPHHLVLHGAHHYGLVLLSVCVSIFSATMALQTAQIARSTENALYRHIAIFTGAIALGGGIWTTHFIGMLAFELPAPVAYSTGLTLFSLVPACVASWLALRMLSLPEVTGRQLLGSGVLVGAGIGMMHYSGMAAMQTPLEMRYEAVTFFLSIVVAVVLATLALWVRFGLQRTQLSRMARFLVAGCVLGLATASMHYTGMISVRFIGEAGVPQGALMLNATYASLILSSFTITVTLMVVAVNGLIRSHELYRRLDEGSSRLRATLETAVDGIITINTKGIIQDFNRSAERLFGWSAEEVMGKNIKMLMPEPYQSAHDGYLHNYLTSGTAKIIGTGREVVGLRKDGSHMPMRLAVGRVELSGQLLFVGFVSDISDRHALEVSLRETAERAEQAAAAKSTFLANMSHEIRTPMNSIIGFTELLLQTDLSAMQRSHLDTIRQSSRSLLGLINDILDTTKMEKGRLELEFNDFSLKALAMQIESSLRLSAQAKNLALITRYPDDMPVHYRGDALRVLQILNNLVGNAIKFTEVGSVEVVFAYEAGEVHVQVRDTGIGMTAQQMDSIFSPFIQADASISRRFGGTGLGTTIARQLVEQMGGCIEVESTLGYGSTFHVRIPLPVGVAPTPDSDEGQREALPPLNVLIADDVPQNLELLALTLEADGHTVTQARDGHEAASRFKEGRFDLVLMDVHMPAVDGLQATRLIRQHERLHGLARTPIVALTASVMDADRNAARQAGMDGFALKPLDLPQLFAEIARVLKAPAAQTQASENRAEAGASAIDWAAGVTLWGSEERLMAALQQFLESAHDQYRLPDLLSAHTDRDALQFALHGLRGSAGNLALPKVSALARRAEETLREAAPEAVEALLAELRVALDAARHELAARTVKEPAPTHDDLPTASVPESDSMADVHRLLHIMQRSELDDDTLNAVCAFLEYDGEHAISQGLRDAIDAFEFREAATLLEEFIARRSCGVSL